MSEYAEHYDENRFRGWALRWARSLGAKALQPVLELHGVLKSPTTPVRDKLVALTALGYCVLPIDVIPEAVMLAAGLGDDLAVVATALALLRRHVTPEISAAAKARAETLVGLGGVADGKRARRESNLQPSASEADALSS